MKRILLALVLVPMANYAMDSASISDETLIPNGEAPEEAVVENKGLVSLPLEQGADQNVSSTKNTQQGHTRSINSAKFNEAGEMIVTTSNGKTARIGDVKTGECVATLAMDSVLAADENLAKELLNNEESIWGSFPGELSNLLARRLLYNHPVKHYLLAQITLPSKTLQGHTERISSAKFNGAGNMIVTASDDHTAMIWDAKTGECVTTLTGHTDPVNSAEFNDAGDKIVTASFDRTVKIWDVSSGECLATLAGHEDAVNSAQFNGAGDKIVTASDDNTAKIWDVETGECLKTLTGHEKAVLSVQFNSAGDRIVTGSMDCTVKIWDVYSGECLATLAGHDGWVRSAEFNVTGDKIVTASDDGSQKIWNAVSGECLATLPRHDGFANFAQFNKAGDKIVTAFDDKTKIWDVSSGECLATLTGHSAGFWSAQFNTAGEKIVTASLDGTAKIWDVMTDKCLATLIGHDGWVTSAEFNDAGDKIVTASDDKTVKIWDISPLLELENFLARRVTLKQAFILNAIYEVVLARALVKKHGKNAFQVASDRVAGLAHEGGADLHEDLSYNKITFDFTKYPHLQEHYDALPQVIQVRLDHYVTKMTGQTQQGQEIL